MAAVLCWLSHFRSFHLISSDFSVAYVIWGLDKWNNTLGQVLMTWNGQTLWNLLDYMSINVFRIVFDHCPMGLFSDIGAILNSDVSNSYCGVLRGANLYVFTF